ncbi:MAG: hypothetical protein NPINA01_08810 [Nitrospinaceae bacterium]|nr:MAG: hypothetical protein NPINA01_08810 [Nitrospinaceae bacterium]
MELLSKLPATLFTQDRINLYYLHETFKGIAERVSLRLKQNLQIDVPLTGGMWGGSYLVADETGRARTNVVRLYNIVSLPQNSPLEDCTVFEQLMETYCQTAQTTFKNYGLEMVDPRWGESIPYTNKIKPTTTMQMWDASKRVKFHRAFFVWNSAPWEESVIYDAIRNIKVLKELLDINQRPGKKSKEELKFLLQDVLITYFTLLPALTPDFAEHAEPIIKELLNHFLAGMNDVELIEEQFSKVYSNALVYGYEEALEGPYKEDGLDIRQVENWPVEKINWVPRKLKESLGPYLKNTFTEFKINLDKEMSGFPSA